MIHIGDIQKIDWSTVPPVDCVTGGSPCQDLSVAGKRAGLAGERSGLYMEQIRCIKELRKADEQRGRTGQFIRPRYMVWENVPGAFSSNKGKDFAAVLEEAVKVIEPEAPAISVPEGGWPYAGCLTDGVAGKWSVAWRVHDAQFYGVPQRRRRIALVCDFGGLSAPEILFERKGVSWNHEESGAQREEAAGGAGGGADSTGGFTNRGSASGNITETLRANSNGALPMVVKRESHEPIPINTMIATRHNALGRGTGFGVGEEGEPQFTLSSNHCHAICAEFSFGQSEKAGSIGYQEEVSPTLRGGEGGNQKPCVLCLNDQGGSVMDVSEQAGTLRAQSHGHEPLVFDCRGNGDGKTVCTMTGDHQSRVTDYTALCIGNGQTNQIPMSETANTLDTMHDQQAIICMAAQQGGAETREDDKAPTLTASAGMSGNNQPVVCYGLDCEHNAYQDQYGTMRAHSSGGAEHKVMVGTVVRRLTPLECERLQGYPDGWTDIGEWTDSKGKKHKPADSPRYKALGNSIALPFWFWLLRRISAQYYGPATLGSLFDGIGGFPLCWERCNGKGTALWASEIEEFPIAVTKRRFGGENGEERSP